MQKSGQKQSDQEQRQITTSNIIIADACAGLRLFFFFFYTIRSILALNLNAGSRSNALGP